jgi:RNA polymerase sigma-70 factor (ECF subfamily)
VTSVAIGRTDQLDPRLLEHRRELTGYCYRMLGSSFDAEDAVQETLVRAWRGLGDFEGRSALRSWLYRIATNVCLDSLAGRQRRALPMDLAGSPSPPVESSLAARRPGTAWIEPILDRQVIPEDADPAERAVARESIRLAFIAALQHLPPRQRAVLILREVLRWKADEVAQLLDTTVASVNSALQRARATLAASNVSTDDPAPPMDEAQRELLARYVDAFQRYDIDSLTSLLHEDATQSMPPYALWLSGRDNIFDWWFGPGSACRDSILVPTRANGLPAFGQYKPDGKGGHAPWALQLIRMSGDRIVEMTFFLDTANLFPLFGLPLQLDS